MCGIEAFVDRTPAGYHTIGRALSQGGACGCAAALTLGYEIKPLRGNACCSPRAPGCSWPGESGLAPAVWFHNRQHTPIGSMVRAMTTPLVEQHESLVFQQRSHGGLTNLDERYPEAGLLDGPPSSGVSQNEKVIKENPGVSDLWSFRDIRYRRQRKAPSLRRSAAFCDRPASRSCTHFARRAGTAFFRNSLIFSVRTALRASCCWPAKRLGLPLIPAPVGADPVRKSPADYHGP